MSNATELDLAEALPATAAQPPEAARLPRACSGLGVAALALLAGFAPVALLCIAARLFR